MTSSGKFILCLAVLFCVVQAIAARPRLDAGFFQSVKFDLMKKCAGVEKDIEKETLNVRYKLEKESLKLLKKATKEGSVECVESAKLQAEEELDEKSQEIADRIQDLKDSLETNLQPEATLQEIISFKSEMKNKLSACKKNSKMDLKNVQNGFSVSGKACLV